MDNKFQTYLPRIFQLRFKRHDQEAKIKKRNGPCQKMPVSDGRVASAETNRHFGQ